MALEPPGTAGGFVDRLLTYLRLTDGSVTSYVRSRQRNTAVGGVAHSGHLIGMAADVVYDVPPPREQREEWAKRLGLMLVVEGDHDHLQPANWPAG